MTNACRFRSMSARLYRTTMLTQIPKRSLFAAVHSKTPNLVSSKVRWKCPYFKANHSATQLVDSHQHRRHSSAHDSSHGAAGGSNKPGDMLLTQQSYQHILSHTREHQVLQRLRQATAEEWPNAARMQVSPEQGRFLSWLVGCSGAVRALEVGVFTGYSACCIAQALPSAAGVLVGLERDERPLTLARQAFRDLDISSKIDIRIEEAAAALQKLVQEDATFDLAFVDADKRSYSKYHELLMRLVRVNGLIVYDNMLWYGAVADPQDVKKSTQALRDFTQELMVDDRIDFSLVPIGDGLALCRRLQ